MVNINQTLLFLQKYAELRLQFSILENIILGKTFLINETNIPLCNFS